MAISLETFIKLDEGLAKTLFPAWKRHALPIATKIGEAVEDGDLTTADRLIDTLDLGVVLKTGIKDIRIFAMMSLLFGASQLNRTNNTVFKGKKNPSIIDESMDHFTLTVLELTKEIRKALRKGIQDWQDRQDQEREQSFKVTPISKARRVRPFVSFAQRSTGAAGLSSLQLASSLHMSRLSAWGYTEEARALGIVYYKVNEQLDNRTCPVCREMHGRVFAVADVRGRLDTVLRIDDPSHLKVINPFPRQDALSVQKLKRMRSDDIVKNGWDSPPYHPLCRGLLTAAGKDDKLPYTPTAPRSTSQPRIGPEIQTATDREVDDVLQRVAFSESDLNNLSLTADERTAVGNLALRLGDPSVPAADKVEVRDRLRTLLDRDLNGNRIHRDFREVDGIPLREAAQELNREFSAHMRTQYNGKQDDIFTYTGSAYTRINGAIRSAKGDVDKVSDPHLKEIILGADRGLESTALAYDTTVWRGSSVSRSRVTPDDIRNGFIEDFAFMSTSINKRIAESFAGSTSRTHISYLWRIRLNKGQKGAWVDEISDNKGEYEYMLPRNTRLRTVSMSEIPGSDNGYGPTYLVEAVVE